MLYLIKLSILFFFCFSTYANENPFSIMLNIKNNDAAGEQDQHLVLKIRSVSNESARFMLKVQVPKTHIEIIEGKDLYKGLLKGLEEKEYFLVVKGIKDGEGEISVKVFPVVEDIKIDNENMRMFTAKYKVNNEFAISLSDLIEKELTPKQIVQQGIGVKIEGNEVIDNEKDADKAKAAQHFVLEGTFRHNKIYRNLMVLISVLILGYLYMRIRKPN